MKSYDQDVSKWIKFAEVNGIKRNLALPPLDILIRKIGLRCPPSFFWHPLTSFSVVALFFFIVMAGVVFFPVWTLEDEDRATALFYSLIAGVLAGLITSLQQFRGRKSLHLSTWEEFVDRQ